VPEEPALDDTAEAEPEGPEAQQPEETEEVDEAPPP
jgi:hypothetical protein